MASDEPRDASAKDAPEQPRKSAMRENVEAIITAALFAIFVRGFVAQPYKIPSGSMKQNLLIGDHLVVNKLVYGDGAADDGFALVPTRPVRRGDVVIFRPPDAPNTDYIKRVIGLPGERLDIRYNPKLGNLVVEADGETVPESFRDRFGELHEVEDAEWTVDYGAVRRARWFERSYTLGPGQYFMMGDNRYDSQDSRAWSRHEVDAERIRGHAWLIYWSYEADEDNPEPGPSLVDRVVFYGKIAAGFVTKSRWRRTFHRI